MRDLIGKAAKPNWMNSSCSSFENQFVPGISESLPRAWLLRPGTGPRPGVSRCSISGFLAANLLAKLVAEFNHCAVAAKYSSTGNSNTENP
jgi:hypothetical protein